MKCPYCGREMDAGLIQSLHELSWIPGKTRKTFAKADFYEGSVVLSEESFWKGSAATAWICKACEKVVVDYSDKQSDLNNRS